MIDLMNENNGHSDKIPAPISTDPIVAMLDDMAIYDGEPPLMVLSSIISELKMWRAKDEYDKKMKMVMSSAIMKQFEKNNTEIDDE